MINTVEAFVAAKEHEKAAHFLMEKLLPVIPGSSLFSDRQRPVFSGEIAPILTNMAFCIELLLKTLYFINNLKSNEKLGHNISAIFDKLPAKVRENVASEYIKEMSRKPHLWSQCGSEKKAFPDLVVISYNRLNGLAESQRSAMVEFKWSHSDPASLPIQDVLNRHAKAFVEFRYSWENWHDSSPKDLTFDFLRIHILSQVLKYGLINFTPLGRHNVEYMDGKGNKGTFSLTD